VHLLGIVPSRGSQSIQLLQEADTTTELSRAAVARFLSIAPTVTPAAAAAAVAASGVAPAMTVSSTAAPTGPAAASVPLPATAATWPAIAPNIAADLDQVIADLVAAMSTPEIAALKTHCASSRSVPSGYDGKLLARGRASLFRALDPREKRYIRARFQATIIAI